MEQEENREPESLVFEPSFFQEEDRDGFHIEGMMKNAWAAQLNVLYRIDRICRQWDIPYYAGWGTLLGAVRHQGFIPWDDDVDICMTREAQERLYQVLQEHDYGLRIRNIDTNPDWGISADNISNEVDYTLDRHTLKDNYGFPFAAGVDVFTLYRIPDDKEKEQSQVALLNLIASVYGMRQQQQAPGCTYAQKCQLKSREKQTIQQIKRKTGKRFLGTKPTDQEIIRLWKEEAQKYESRECACIGQMDCLCQGRDYHFPKEVFEKTRRMPFENITVSVPEGYDLVLKKNYGEDYMTPVNRTGGHDYPFYQVGIRTVAEETGKTKKEMTDYIRRASSQYYQRFLNKSAEPSLQYLLQDLQQERQRIWAAQLEVYVEVKRICDACDIPLFAIGDTAQGAREAGYYLPESEDLHLAIYREDYIRFLELLPTELDPWFDYCSVYTEGNHEDLRCYVITDPYLCREQDYEQRFHGCPHIVGVDIAAIDGISEDGSKEEMRRTMVESLVATAAQMPVDPPYSKEILDVVQQWESLTGCTISTEGNLRKEFVKTADLVAGAYRGKPAQLCIFPELVAHQGGLYDVEAFAKARELDFGPVSVLVPEPSLKV